MVTAGEHLDGYADTPAREVTYRDGESILDASILPPASGRAGRNDGDGVQDDAEQAASGPTARKLPERTGGDGVQDDADQAGSAPTMNVDRATLDKLLFIIERQDAEAKVRDAEAKMRDAQIQELSEKLLQAEKAFVYAKCPDTPTSAVPAGIGGVPGWQNGAAGGATERGRDGAAEDGQGADVEPKGGEPSALSASVNAPRLSTTPSAVAINADFTAPVVTDAHGHESGDGGIPRTPPNERRSSTEIRRLGGEHPLLPLGYCAAPTSTVQKTTTVTPEMSAVRALSMTPYPITGRQPPRDGGSPLGGPTPHGIVETGRRGLHDGSTHVTTPSFVLDKDSLTMLLEQRGSGGDGGSSKSSTLQNVPKPFSGKREDFREFRTSLEQSAEINGVGYALRLSGKHCSADERDAAAKIYETRLQRVWDGVTRAQHEQTRLYILISTTLHSGDYSLRAVARCTTRWRGRCSGTHSWRSTCRRMRTFFAGSSASSTTPAPGPSTAHGKSAGNRSRS